MIPHVAFAPRSNEGPLSQTSARPHWGVLRRRQQQWQQSLSPRLPSLRHDRLPMAASILLLEAHLSPRRVPCIRHLAAIGLSCRARAPGPFRVRALCSFGPAQRCGSNCFSHTISPLPSRSETVMRSCSSRSTWPKNWKAASRGELYTGKIKVSSTISDVLPEVTIAKTIAPYCFLSGLSS